MTMPSPEQRAAGSAPAGFVAFLALMTAVVALTIDAVLPALDTISDDLGMAGENDRHGVLLAVFAGLGIGQPVFGPLADALGRRRAALLGWGIYIAGTLMCVGAATPAVMLAGRFLQGFGAAGPRLVAIAILRDLYEGRAMARMISLVMTIFMLVPILAPLAGQVIEGLAGWRAIFGLYLALALVSGGWYLASLPETLAPADRRPLRLGPLLGAYGTVLRDRAALSYAGAAACVFGPFVTYLSTAQQILEEGYGLGPLFPLAFAAIAIAFAGASFLNSRLVMGMGMRRLCILGLTALTAVSATGALLTLPALGGGPLPLWQFMGLMALVFICIAVLFSNFNALALRALGHVAGTASAVVMSLATLGAVPVGWFLGRHFDGSLTPLFAGFCALGLAGLGFFRLAESRR